MSSPESITTLPGSSRCASKKVSDEDGEEWNFGDLVAREAEERTGQVHRDLDARIAESVDVRDLRGREGG